jgi:hypothetical protein
VGKIIVDGGEIVYFIGGQSECDIVGFWMNAKEHCGRKRYLELSL